MLEKEELKPRRNELVLYRCACGHCDAAEDILGRLAKEYGAFLEVKRVDTEASLSGWAGWRTPVVYLDGRQISHYQVSEKRWKETLKAGRACAPSVVIGEVVDIHCYMHSKSTGEEHAKCAEECVKAGQPIGLLSRKGELYLLIEERAYKDAYARIKELVSQEVAITGDICERGGVQALIVRKVEVPSRAGI